MWIHLLLSPSLPRFMMHSLRFNLPFVPFASRQRHKNRSRNECRIIPGVVSYQTTVIHIVQGHCTTTAPLSHHSHSHHSIVPRPHNNNAITLYHTQSQHISTQTTQQHSNRATRTHTSPHNIPHHILCHYHTTAAHNVRYRRTHRLRTCWLIHCSILPRNASLCKGLCTISLKPADDHCSSEMSVRPVMARMAESRFAPCAL